MAKFGIGQAVPRAEDPRLLTGGGQYTDDVSLPGQAVGYVLRSPYAHAEIRAIDLAGAGQSPGVIGIVTGQDLEADGIGPIAVKFAPKNRGGWKMPEPPRPALAVGRVRHVGDPVALVVAETLAQAKDAAELIEVDYDPLPIHRRPRTVAGFRCAQGMGPGPRQSRFRLGGWGQAGDR